MRLVVLLLVAWGLLEARYEDLFIWLWKWFH